MEFKEEMEAMGNTQYAMTSIEMSSRFTSEKSMIYRQISIALASCGVLCSCHLLPVLAEDALELEGIEGVKIELIEKPASSVPCSSISQNPPKT